MLLKNLAISVRLRAILLFEGDFNQSNKLLGRTVMKQTEAAITNAEEQYGSRKHRAAVDQCLNKQLTSEVFRQHTLKCYGLSLAMQRDVSLPLSFHVEDHCGYSEIVSEGQSG
jgi:hypothetical protein